MEIPFEKGLLGHSDADVLLHAIADALLGACGLPDIGVLFPDNDPSYEGISSLILIERVSKELRRQNARIINIDSTVIAQSPRLSPYIGQMREKTALALGINAEDVNIKATTEERLGFTGSGEGISMTLNKHQHIRAALVWEPEIAHMTRLHNDANVLVMPGRYISTETASKIMDEFLGTAFEGGRHIRRIEKIPVSK